MSDGYNEATYAAMGRRGGNGKKIVAVEARLHELVSMRHELTGTQKARLAEVLTAASIQIHEPSLLDKEF